MKILVVCQHYWPEPFNVAETCELLADRGHEVTVLTGLPNYPEGAVLEEYKRGRNREQTHNGVRIVRSWICARGANLNGINKIRRVLNYVSFPVFASGKKILKNVEFDVVLAFQYSPILMVVPALIHSKRAGKRCLLYAFDLWPEDMLTGGISRSGFPYRIMREVSRKLYSAADLIAITSPGFRRYFDEVLNLRPVGVSYIPQYAEAQFEVLGGNPGTHNFTTDDRDGVHIVFAGNIGGNQAVDNIVRAAALVEDEARITVHLIGSGSKLEECKDLANRLGASNVVFHGRLPLEAMPTYYAMADAMLLTLASGQGDSLVPKLTIPRKLQSYLAAGKPVIVSADGMVADLVEEAQCGLCSKAEDPEDLAKAMINFASLPRINRALMGQRAADYYASNFSKNLFLERLESDLMSLKG